MLDLHPVTEQQVEAEDGIVGVIREPEFIGRGLANVEASVAQVVTDGLYALEVEVDFDVLQHFDTPGDLLDRKGEELEGQRQLVEQIRSLSGPFVVREHVVLRRLRMLTPPAS
jgi:hypothetical protein